ncbi:MAG: HDIG domain-containing protein [Candidatus Cloacimonetes bacterium]|nr:HDIG domain-containing protein [Candidatus Cloacimonadota bacterium]MBS3767944.1 HDIG domain-containing protein [Candidatus Cloacimonadota bacterium]
MKKTISIEKIYRALIYVAIAALLIFLANFIITRKGLFSKQITYETGEIADRTVVAPFNFYLYEDEDVLKKKQKKAAAEILPHYTFSADASFTAMKKLNRFFEILEKGLESNKLDQEILSELQQAGFNITAGDLSLLKEKETRTKVYENLMHNLEKIMQRGISGESIKSDKIILLKEGNKIEINSDKILTPKRAGEYFLELTEGKDFFNQQNNRKLAVKLLQIVVKDNVEYDAESTARAKELAKSSVPKIVGEVLKNELIVQKHQKVANEIHKKLEALQRERAERYVQTEKAENVFPLIGQFFYIIFILLIFVPLFYILDRDTLIQLSLFRAVLLLTVLTAILTIALNNIESISAYILPFGMSIILLCFLMGTVPAVIFGLVNFLLLYSLLDWQFAGSFIISFAGISAIVGLNNPRSRRNFYVASFYYLLFFIFFSLLMGAIKSWSIIEILSNLQWGFGAVVTSLFGSMVLLAPFEQRLPVATNIHLQEIGDFNSPLLKTLSEVASGTYHHSVIVGNLAEAAAKAIGANPILARVGSYYHDVGKTKHPEYFIENSSEEENVHNELSSTESAKKIKQHVEDGVKLAKKNNLPQSVVDIIKQHHGTSKISFFYNQALENEEQIDEVDFHYDGPKPQSKETAIIMISDIVESATKALPSANKEEIDKVLKKAIYHLIETDQLSECGISLQELKALQIRMRPILIGIYKKRISYPE